MNLSELLLTRVRLKLLSLLFAAVLWLFVTLEAGDEQEFSVELKPVRLRQGLTADVNPPRVTARLGGPRTLLLRQQIVGLSGELDLGQSGPGTVRVDHVARGLQVIPGLKVITVVPQSQEVIISQKK